MCACKETEVRESPNVSIFAGMERQGGRGETGYSRFVQKPVSSMIKHLVEGTLWKCQQLSGMNLGQATERSFRCFSKFRGAVL
jgi:hypothetical protein